MIALALGLALLARDANGWISLADVPDYESALKATGPARPVSFRELWDHPQTYRGQRVRVEGRADRRFRQSAVGRLPALVELWLTTDEGNVIALVFPGQNQSPALGQRVRFEGTFLRIIRYPSGDGDRLAPLVVGGEPPLESRASLTNASNPWSRTDWAVAGVLAVVAGLVLATVHLRRPRRRVPPERSGQ